MFSDKIGEVFVVEEPDAPAIAMTLSEVTALQNFRGAPRQPFSLIFTSQGGSVLPQRMYYLRHETLGRQWMFLVPIAGTKDAVTYQAIFN